MTNIPHARKLITSALDDLEPFAHLRGIDKGVADLRAALAMMTRVPVSGKRKRISTPMTPQVAMAMAADIRANPGEAHQIIGDRLGVLGGRVCEMIQGKHDKLLPPHLRFADRDRPGEGPRFKLETT